jgi:AcrR family transcriptional regulator
MAMQYGWPMPATRRSRPSSTTAGAVELREPPRSRRGEKTRAALIDSARVVFERDGFLDARLRDITDHAGVASGTFYTYFDDKEQAFAAVVEEVQEDMLHPNVDGRAGDGDVAALIDAATRAYLTSYARNARLMALFEQVAQIDPEFAELRRKRGQAFTKRNAKLIARLQKEGRADPEIDPYIAAHALSSMVGRTAYAAYVLGERIDPEALAVNLNRLWVNALRLDWDSR